MRRLKPLLRRLAIGVGVLLAILILFIIEENIRGRVARNAYMRQLRGRGERLTVVEPILTESSPPDDTLAGFMAAGQELEVLQRDCPFQVEGQISFGYTDRWRHVLKYPWYVVRHQEPDLGVYSRFGSTKGRGPLTRTDWITWDELDKQVGRANDALAQIGTLLSIPVPIISTDFSRIEVTNRFYFSAKRKAVNWLAVASLGDLHRGDLDAAVRDIALIATLSRWREYRPLLSSEYARLHAADVGLYMAWETLQAVGVTEEQLARLQTVWEGRDLDDEVIKTLEDERVRRLSYFEKVRRSPKALWERCKGEMSCCHECGGSCDLGDLWFDTRAVSRVVMWRLAWLDRDELEFLKQWQDCLDQAREAIAHGNRSRFHSDKVTTPAPRSWYNAWPFWFDGRRFLLSSELRPDDDMMVLRPMRIETERRMAIVAIALKRYELAHGVWPDSLPELTPTFLTDVPRDLMDGQPLRYHGNEDGTFTLYSVGQNSEDDGGSSERDHDHLPNSWMWMTCDALWPMPAPPEDATDIELPQEARGRRGELHSFGNPSQQGRRGDIVK